MKELVDGASEREVLPSACGDKLPLGLQPPSAGIHTHRQQPDREHSFTNSSRDVRIRRKRMRQGFPGESHPAQAGQQHQSANCMGHEARPEDEIADEQAIDSIEDKRVHLERTMGRADISPDASRPTEARRKKRDQAVYRPEKVAEQGRNGHICGCRPWTADCKQPGTPLSAERDQRRYKIEQIKDAGDPSPGRGRDVLKETCVTRRFHILIPLFPWKEPDSILATDCIDRKCIRPRCRGSSSSPSVFCQFEAAVTISKSWGCSSAGRAPRSQRGGQRFDPAQLHHFPPTSAVRFCFLAAQYCLGGDLHPHRRNGMYAGTRAR